MLPLVVLMILRKCIASFPMSPFVCLSPLAASSAVSSALHLSGTRLLKAMMAGSVQFFTVISRYPSKLMSFTTLSIAQGSSTPFFRTTLPVMF